MDNFDPKILHQSKKPDSFLATPVEDIHWEVTDFRNYMRSLVFLFQMMAQDGWGTHYSLLVQSPYSSIAFVLVCTLPLIVAMIIHGFIIATFLDEIIRIREKDVV